ncbi:sensor histidine kinase [Gracilibacillus oryzae]|uniref:histidine kinase n=2 Tax=Gracilibacillus oryzae TaxID=1672701 RepID=A0A7C8L6T7_9BACI|nr:sensor histidine kinase [Gracilibacillus oryzae]
MFMNRMKLWFINLKFRRKILFICIIASLFPIIALASFWYYQIQDSLMKRENENLSETLNQAISNLDYKVNNYFNIINQIVWNDEIKKGVTAEYINNFEMYQFYQETLVPQLRTSLSLQIDINTISVYSDNQMNPHGKFLLPLSDVKEQAWFDTIVNTHSPTLIVSAEDRTFHVLCQIFDRDYSKTNIVHMDVSYNHVFDTMSSLFEDNFGLIILDENKKPVYFYQDLPGDVETLSANHLINKIEEGLLDQDYVYDQASLASSKWTAYLYRPKGIISASTSQLRMTVIGVVILCISILILAIFLLARVVVRPLEKLARNMEQIEKGDLSVTVFNSGTDEIGNLIRQFGIMVVKLKDMINQVYKSKIAQQEYEMKALQAQINPHFFYNSLSLINSKAIMSGQDDISQMAQLLSKFYRTTLNKGDNIISVKGELENTTSYIEIQRMMHSNSFDVHYEIDDGIYHYNMLNLLLQPLVENAINHGIDHKENPGKGKVTLIAAEQDNELIFKVMDNGCGIKQEILDTILTTETKGYGVRNVHNRVQLYYGTGYGLVFESKLNEGTTVTLIIPKEAENNKNN